MRAIVTGGLGFVGSWLVEALKEADDNVTVLDNLSRPVIRPDESLADALLAGSVFDGLRELSPARYETYDIIWHLASPVGPGAIKRGMDICWQIVSDTKYILDFAKRTCAKVVLFSSPEVYGWHADRLLNEQDRLEIALPYDIRREYPIGKIAAECMALNRVGIQAQVIRPYNVIGPRQSASGGFVIARFAEQLRQGKPLTIFYGGGQRRQFTSVHDVIRFCMMLRQHWPRSNEIWNVANPQVWPVYGVAQMMQAAWAPRPCAGVKHVDPTVELSNPDYRETEEKLVDISKAKAYGWWAKDNLADVIKELLT